MKKRSILYLSIIIAIFNMFDAWFTNYGMTNHLIEELNPFMNMIIKNSPLLFLLIKALLSVLIIFMSYVVYRHSSERFKSMYSLSLIPVCLLYFSIFIVHLTWLSVV